MSQGIIIAFLLLTPFLILLALFFALMIYTFLYINSTRKLLSYLKEKHPDQSSKFGDVIMSWFTQFSLRNFIYGHYFKLVRWLKEIDTRNDPELLKMKSKTLGLYKSFITLFIVFVVIFIIVFVLFGLTALVGGS